MTKNDKSKYLTVQNKLNSVELASMGLTHERIEEFLGLETGILTRTMKRSHQFKREMENAELKLNLDVENALLRRALGYETIEEHTVYIHQNKENETPDTLMKIKETKKVKKFIPPDSSAALIWLYNRRGERWSKNPNAGNNISVEEYLDEKERLADLAQQNM